MPILSFITFDGGHFKGAFAIHNHPYTSHLRMTRAGHPAALVYVRPDDEVTINLRAAIDTDGALAAIDERLKGTLISRTSRIFTEPVAWRDMPQHGHTPNRHRPHDLFLRVWVKFFMSTPAYCSPDAAGDISYYVALALDDFGRFRAWVDAWSFDFDSGFWCVTGVEDALDSFVPQSVEMVQGVIDQALASVQGLHFQAIYLLPGSGTRVPGTYHGTCDTGAALALIPMKGEW
jgi:hypothetical protein